MSTTIKIPTFVSAGEFRDALAMRYDRSLSSICGELFTLGHDVIVTSHDVHDYSIVIAHNPWV